MRRRSWTASSVGLSFLLVLAADALAQAPPATVTAAGREPKLTLGGLLQVQGEAGDRGDGRFGSANDRFYLRRARLNAQGRFLEEFEFRLEAEFGGSLAEASSLRAQMTDGYIQWNRYTAANVRLGQFKSPFGFEQLYSDPRLVLIERSLVNDRLTSGRQIGVQVGGDLFEKKVTYAIGVFNGNGVNTSANDNDELATFGRLSFQAYRGAALGADTTLAIGFSALSSEDAAVSIGGLGFDSTPATADRDNLFAGERYGRGYDLQLKVPARGFELWAEWLEVHFEPVNARPLREVDAEGYYLQASYYVLPTRLEVVLKQEQFDPSTAIDDNETTIETVGLSWYFKSHDLKAMLNVLRVDDALQAETATRVLARLQVIF
jgi:phosphate-selective porin OprO/OprP